MTSLIGDLLAAHLHDAESSWSCGSFGAIAEFIRVPDEAVVLDTEAGLSACTERGAIRIDPTWPGLRPLAYELTSNHPRAWQQGVALCLPEDDCAMHGRRVVTELGPDAQAVRAQDRAAIVFDLGLGTLQADILVRSSDARTIQCLRAGLGRSLFEPGNRLAGEIVGLSPHRVFQCRFGRVEVYQPIPTPDGQSPDGPHTHLLPKLLANGRTHAANLPIPDGWVPCMTLFPPHPMRDRMGHIKAFDANAFEAFQRLWRTYGDPALVAIKAAALDAAHRGVAFDEPDSRAGRMMARVALRQASRFPSSTPIEMA